MLTKTGPKVLEFNARFGDPETQVYLPRLRSDLLAVLEASAGGALVKLELKWTEALGVCVVMASAGYPGTYSKGKIIGGLEAVAKLPDVKVFHAGTALVNGSLMTSGGRVLGVTATGNDLRSARDKAYKAVDRHACFRLRQWLRRKHKKKGAGTKTYSDEYLYERLGLVRLERLTKNLPWAKAAQT